MTLKHKLTIMAGMLAIGLSGCIANTNAKDKNVMNQPASITKILDNSANSDAGKTLAKSAEAIALKAKLIEYLRGSYRITQSGFEKQDSYSSWSQISLFVANERGAIEPGRTGGANLERPEWYRPGLDLIDVYPADKKYGAFAVAMSNTPMADGSKLAGYFTIEPVVP